MNKKPNDILNQCFQSRVLLVLLFCIGSAFVTQSYAQTVKATLENKELKIGEELKLGVIVNATEEDEVVFPTLKDVGLFEVINTYETDTLRKDKEYQLFKKYGLIHFDEGTAYIPPIKIEINKKPFFTDTLEVQLQEVAVDTTKQKLYDIKPIIEVGEPKKDFPYVTVGIIFLVAGVLVWLFLYFILKKKRIKEEAMQEIPPFEEAISQLEGLDKQSYLERGAYKAYYSELTDILKRYLENDVYSNALEQTTDELLTKLTLLSDSGELPLSKELINDLREVLQTSDLVKFAKSIPDEGIAKADRSVIEKMIVTTKEVKPGPTPEEIWETEMFQQEMERKRKKQQRTVIGVSVFSAIVLIVVSLGFAMGFKNLKDTVLQHETKLLLEGQWVRSEYGSPAIVVSTPQVLTRVFDEKTATGESESFGYGSLSSSFAIQLNITELPIDPSIIKQGNEEQSEDDNEPLIDLEVYNEKSLQHMELNGASDILVKQEEYKTKDGFKGMKAYGSMSLADAESKEKHYAKYQIITFSQEGAVQQLMIFYEEDDTYAEEIVDKVLAGVELKKVKEDVE